MIRGVLFDLGGTLLSTPLDGQWVKAFPKMDADLLASLKALGYRLDGEAFIQRFGAIYTALDRQCQADWLEVTTAQVLTQTLAELGAPPLSPPAQAQALRSYYAYTEALWQPRPGVQAILSQLLTTGHKLAIISNANDSDNVWRLIDGAQLRGYFDPILISATVGLRKPAPKIFQLALEQWGLPASECAMVGDTPEADILGAHLAGLHSVWLPPVRYLSSAHAQPGPITPEATLATLTDLPAVLAAW